MPEETPATCAIEWAVECERTPIKRLVYVSSIRKTYYVGSHEINDRLVCAYCLEILKAHGDVRLPWIHWWNGSPYIAVDVNSTPEEATGLLSMYEVMGD